jgi:ABC-type phosphate/phosphonate transport system substrate-binding protein
MIPPSYVARALLVCAISASATILASGQQDNPQELRIGNSGSLKVVGGNEKDAIRSMQSFIKDETGFNNEIIRERDWQELADKMAQKQLQLGAFQGFEFAWAQQKHPELKPAALAVNVYVYPVFYIVARNDNSANAFAGLQGQTVAVPQLEDAYGRLVLAKQAQDNGKKLDAFFSKIETPENIEDAIDNVVDGAVQVAVCDRTGLEAYKRRKPGRFNRLKEITHSQALPPPLVAYYDSVLDQATLDKFRQGLLNASHSDRGQSLLTLFHLTGFVNVPNDFDKVVADTRKNYPPSLMQTK